MKIGDVVVFRGVVKDIVGGNVLTVASLGEREHWFLAVHLQVETEAAEAEVDRPAVPVFPSTPPTLEPTPVDPEFDEALKIVMGHGYNEQAARKIIAQVGAGTILRSEKEEPVNAAGAGGPAHPTEGIEAAEEETLKKAAAAAGNPDAPAPEAKSAT